MFYKLFIPPKLVFTKINTSGHKHTRGRGGGKDLYKTSLHLFYKMFYTSNIPLKLISLKSILQETDTQEKA